MRGKISVIWGSKLVFPIIRSTANRHLLKKKKPLELERTYETNSWIWLKGCSLPITAERYKEEERTTVPALNKLVKEMGTAKIKTTVKKYEPNSGCGTVSLNCFKCEQSFLTSQNMTRPGPGNTDPPSTEK